MTTLEVFLWTAVTLCALWIIAGIIALLLGSIFLQKDKDYPMTFVNAICIILLGFVALMETSNNIAEESQYFNH